MIRGFEPINELQWKTDMAEFTREGDWPFVTSSIDPDKVRASIVLPKRATVFSAGYDIFSPFAFVLSPGEQIRIPLGIKTYMQPGEYLSIFPRSGQGFKFYIRLANTVGIIDRDYYGNPSNDGHIWLKIRNESAWGTRHTLKVNVGEAICQGIFQRFLLADGDSFSEGVERVGGFGSSG